MAKGASPSCEQKIVHKQKILSRKFITSCISVYKLYIKLNISRSFRCAFALRFSMVEIFGSANAAEKVWLVRGFEINLAKPINVLRVEQNGIVSVTKICCYVD